MTDYRIDRAHSTAQSLASDLTAAGVRLPKEVQTAMAALAAHIERQPRRPDDDAVADIYLSAGSDKEAAAVAARVAHHAPLWDGWAAARNRLARRASSSSSTSADEIIAQLQGIAEPLIQNLAAAAGMATLDTAALLRNNDREGAEVAAHAERRAGELSALYSLRARLSKRTGFGPAGAWKHPRRIAEAEEQHVLRGTMSASERFIVGIRVGGELWRLIRI